MATTNCDYVVKGSVDDGDGRRQEKISVKFPVKFARFVGPAGLVRLAGFTNRARALTPRPFRLQLRHDYVVIYG